MCVEGGGERGEDRVSFFFIKAAAAAVLPTHDRLAGRDDGESESETVRAVFNCGCSKQNKEKGRRETASTSPTPAAAAPP